MPRQLQARRRETQKAEAARQTFRSEATIYFRHAFLIFDLNEKKQRTESST